MTRILEGKRMGFARSEEVGMESLNVAAGGGASDPSTNMLLKQASKDSTDSSHSDKHVMAPEGSLGQFVDDLGPGQASERRTC